MADQAALAAATASSDRPRRHPAARAAKTADVREPTGEAPVLRPVPRRADPPVARDGHAATREGTVVRLITGLSDSRSDRSVAASANDVTTTGNAASWPDDAQDQPRDTLSPGALAQLDRLLTYLERRDRTLLSLVEMLVERNRQDRASVEELRTALARIEEMLAHQRRKTAPTTPTASSSVGRTG
jgi:hypothetical protein